MLRNGGFLEHNLEHHPDYRLRSVFLLPKGGAKILSPYVFDSYVKESLEKYVRGVNAYKKDQGSKFNPNVEINADFRRGLKDKKGVKKMQKF